jgi:hypothetical protein
MKQLTKNWHLVRLLQLSMGLLLIGSYLFYMHDGITLAFGLLLLLQAAFNISCAGGACTTPGYRSTPGKMENEIDEVYIEEI